MRVKLQIKSASDYTLRFACPFWLYPAKIQGGQSMTAGANLCANLLSRSRKARFRYKARFWQNISGAQAFQRSVGKKNLSLKTMLCRQTDLNPIITGLSDRNAPKLARIDTSMITAIGIQRASDDQACALPWLDELSTTLK